jgi:hypothetical protein
MRHVSKDAVNFLVVLIYTMSFGVSVYTNVGLLKFKLKVAQSQ